jgi:hypothetical protein
MTQLFLKLIVASLVLTTASMVQAVETSQLTTVCGSIVDNGPQAFYKLGIKNADSSFILSDINLALTDKQVKKAGAILNSLTVGDSVCLAGWINPTGVYFIPFFKRK